jgi:VWFA-related protein
MVRFPRLAAILLFSGALADAAGVASGMDGVPFVERVRVRSVPLEFVELSVSVVDRDGRAVRGLGPDDFIIEEGGRRQRPEVVRPEDRPLSVAVLIDASGSTREAWPLLRDAAPALASALGPDDAVKVIAFNGPAWMVQDFTRDPAAITASMGSFRKWGGGTSLYDTLAAVGVELAWARDGRQAVVLLTDGVDTLSRIDAWHVRNYLRRTEVTVSTFVLKPRDSASIPGFARFARDLSMLSRETGGTVTILGDLDGLRAGFRRLEEDLRDRYYVAYHSDRRVRAGRWRPIEVKSSRRGLTVRTRSGAVAGRDVAEFLVHDLTEGDIAARAKAAEWLGRLGAGGAEALLRALGDRAAEVRAAAAVALGTMREPRALPALAVLLGDPSGAVRRGAEEALQGFGPAAGPAVIATLEAGGEARLHAIGLLGRIGDPRAIGPLTLLALPRAPMSALPGEDPPPRARPDPRVRPEALRALGMLREQGSAAVFLKAVADPDPVVRRAGLAALSALGHPDAVPLLLRAAVDADAETRTVAHESLCGLLRGLAQDGALRAWAAAPGRAAAYLDLLQQAVVAPETREAAILEALGGRNEAAAVLDSIVRTLPLEEAERARWIADRLR